MPLAELVGHWAYGFWGRSFYYVVVSLRYTGSSKWTSLPEALRCIAGSHSILRGLAWPGLAWRILGWEVGEQQAELCTNVTLSHLDRIPLYKFKSIRRTMTEIGGGSMENLILKGPITKYSMQQPSFEMKGPVPEILKNYLDVSGVNVLGACFEG